MRTSFRGNRANYRSRLAAGAALPRGRAEGPLPDLSNRKASDGTGKALRHHLARRHGRPGHVALGGREAEGRPRPRRARRPLHRGRLPQLQPEGGGALRAARRAGAGAGDDLRLRHDPAPRRAAAEDDPALRDPGRVLRAGRQPGRQDLGAAPGESDQGLPRGEPGDDRRLGRLLPRRRASASSTTPSTSSTATATTPAYALECVRAAAEAGAENVTLCDTNGGSLPDFVAEATAAVVAALGGRGRDRHPHPQRRRVRGRQLARRGRRRRPPGAGRRSTATASAAATPTWPRSCRRCS